MNQLKENKFTDILGYVLLLICISFSFFQYGIIMIYECCYFIFGKNEIMEVVNVLPVGENYIYELKSKNTRAIYSSLESVFSFEMGSLKEVRVFSPFKKVTFIDFKLVPFIIFTIWNVFCFLVIIVSAKKIRTTKQELKSSTRKE